MYDPSVKECLMLTIYNPCQTQSGEVDIKEKKAFVFDENNNLQNAIEHFYEIVRNGNSSNCERSVLINQVLDSLRKEINRSWHKH